MAKMFDRAVFFDAVRGSLFGGSLKQQQVDGMNFKLDVWEAHPYSDDLRHLANPFATSFHETAAAMWPVEEYGKGQGAEYGKPDPVTGYAYYGRGDVQLTWADNYKKMTAELNLSGADDLYWHPDRALDPKISADVMYVGMTKGLFRAPHNLAKYFNATTDDPYNARDIINGDKTRVPSWSNGVSIGNLVAGYHKKFLSALQAAADACQPGPSPEPEPVVATVTVTVSAPPGIVVNVVHETA